MKKYTRITLKVIDSNLLDQIRKNKKICSLIRQLSVTIPDL